MSSYLPVRLLLFRSPGQVPLKCLCEVNQPHVFTGVMATTACQRSEWEAARVPSELQKSQLVKIELEEEEERRTR